MTALDKHWDVLTRDGRTLRLDLSYPRLDDNANAIEIGLCDVRASDGIRISYDFDRNGWKIEQAQVFTWDVEAEENDPEWKEVAFVGAWASQRHNALEGDECGCEACHNARYEAQP